MQCQQLLKVSFPFHLRLSPPETNFHPLKLSDQCFHARSMVPLRRLSDGGHRRFFNVYVSVHRLNLKLLKNFFIAFLELLVSKKTYSSSSWYFLEFTVNYKLKYRRLYNNQCCEGKLAAARDVRGPRAVYVMSGARRAMKNLGKSYPALAQHPKQIWMPATCLLGEHVVDTSIF